MTGVYMAKAKTKKTIYKGQQVAGKPIVIDNSDPKQKILVDSNRFTSEELLACLYFIFDAMERCGLDFFLIRQTAKDVQKGVFANLTGDHIDIGVRLNEWANDHKDLLFPFFDQEHVETVSQLPNELTFKWKDVPFTIHLYSDNPCVTALVPIVFQNEDFKIPNRFDIFEEKYDK